MFGISEKWIVQYCTIQNSELCFHVVFSFDCESKMGFISCFSVKIKFIFHKLINFCGFDLENSFFFRNFSKMVVSNCIFHKSDNYRHEASFLNDFFQQNGVYKLCFQTSNFIDCTIAVVLLCCV